jgi:hypothetical protein
MLAKSWTTTIEEAPDGSGDGILTFPEELIAEKGWSEGTVLNLRVEQRLTGNVLIITESK